MRVPDCVLQPRFELLGVENHFARVNGHNRGERHDEISGVFDVDLELGSAERGHLANGPNLLAAFGDEDLKSDSMFGSFMAGSLREVSGSRYSARTICQRSWVTSVHPMPARKRFRSRRTRGVEVCSSSGTPAGLKSRFRVFPKPGALAGCPWKQRRHRKQHAREARRKVPRVVWPSAS